MESIIKKKIIKESPLKILFQSWTQIPHSYAVVNCFQLIHLYKNYGPNGKITQNTIDIYVEEMPYYRPEWAINKKLVYSKEYNDILVNLKKYNGETVDLISELKNKFNSTNYGLNSRLV